MRIGAALARMALAAGAASLPGGPVRTVFTGKGFHYVAAKLWAAGGQILFDGNGNLHGMSAGGGKPTKRLVSRNCKIDRSCQMSGFALSPNRKIAAVGVCDCGDHMCSEGSSSRRWTPPDTRCRSRRHRRPVVGSDGLPPRRRRCGAVGTERDPRRSGLRTAAGSPRSRTTRPA